MTTVVDLEAEAVKVFVPKWEPKMRILLVDDEPEVADLEAFVLQEAGHMVKVVSKRPEFLVTHVADDIYKDIDVLIVDLMMPGIFGGEILQYVAENYHHIRRIVCTAASPYADEPTVTAYADQVLLKPFLPIDLIAAVEGNEHLS